MGKRKTQAEKDLEAKFDEAYKTLGYGVQVNIMDISKLHADAITAMKLGQDANKAVQSALDKYRVN